MQQQAAPPPPPSSSTRLFIKNLPKHCTDQTLRVHFSNKGKVTDCKVLFKPDGVTSRRVGYVGFQTPQQAHEAMTYFNNTFMDTSKLIVQVAQPKPEMKTNKHGKRTSQVVDARPTATTHKYQEFLSLMRPNSQEAKRTKTSSNQQQQIDDDQNDGDSASGPEMDITSTPPTVTSQSAHNNNNARLFVRNLTFTVREFDLQSLFSQFGKVIELILPLDDSGQSKGYCIVKYADAADASKALVALHEHAFQGRVLRVIYAEPERLVSTTGGGGSGSARSSNNFGQERHEKRRKEAGSLNDKKTWNSLFVRGDAAAGAAAREMDVSKSDLILGHDGDDAAVRVALAEISVVAQTKEWLRTHGVDIDALGTMNDVNSIKSDVVILIKNLPESTVEADVRAMFAKHGGLEAFVMPPVRTMALARFSDHASAKRAFTSLAYSRYKRVPLYLEWAPERTLLSVPPPQPSSGEVIIHDDTINDDATTRTLFVKNLEFGVTEEMLRDHITQTVPGQVELQHVSIPNRIGKRGEALSSGFGFVQFATTKAAKRALKRLDGSELRGHVMAVSFSEKRADTSGVTSALTPTQLEAALPTKLVVRNLAFECTKKDVKSLFESHGTLRSVRLPKNYDGALRGFAFVDFTSHYDAKVAFAALKNAHLYGRHLVIEWADKTEKEEE